MVGTAYPTDFDSWSSVTASPPGTETLTSAGGSRKHSQIHDDLQAAIIALEQTVGKTGAFAFDPTGAAASALASALAAFAAALSGYVPTTRTVNGHALSGDVTVAFSDLSGKPTTLAGYGIASHVVLTDDDGANNWLLNGTTSDGADNRGFAIAAASTGNSSRGAYFGGRGNEYTALSTQRGLLFFVAGNPDTPTGREGCVVFYTGAEVERLRIDPNGLATFANGVAVGGALAFTGSASTTFVTPAGNFVPTKIGVALYDVGAFGQVLALGVGSTVATTARAVLLCDGRTVEHQPTLLVTSPDENQGVGLTWDGSNTLARLVSSVSVALTVGPVGGRVDKVIASSSGVAVTDQLSVTTAGKGLSIKTGANCKMGTGTLSGGTATISTTAVTADSKIFLTDDGGGVLANIGSLSVGTKTAGTSFVVNSSNALDSSNFNWVIYEPA